MREGGSGVEVSDGGSRWSKGSNKDIGKKGKEERRKGKMGRLVMGVAGGEKVATKKLGRGGEKRGEKGK